MANRFPLIINSTSSQVAELPSGDYLDLTGSGIVSLGVGTVASGTTGEIRATGAVTAYYSDVRLKENIKEIPDAVKRVMLLSGVTYNANDLAANYGYKDKSEQVGLLAQDVQKVLPQAVVPAPFDIAQKEDGTEFSKTGCNYLTVQYEKLVPLLVQAIKEQQAQIEELKAKIGV